MKPLNAVKDYIVEYHGHIYHVRHEIHDEESYFDVHMGLENMTPADIRNSTIHNNWPETTMYIRNSQRLGFDAESEPYVAALLLTNGMVIGDRGPHREPYTLYPSRMSYYIKRYMLDGKPIRRRCRRKAA